MPIVSKTFKYQLDSTVEQERWMLRTVGLCNWQYNTALEQRIMAWKYHHRISLNYSAQAAELSDIKAAFPKVFRSVPTCVRTVGWCWTAMRTVR